VRNNGLPDCGLENKRETAARREFEVASVIISWLHSSYGARALPLAIFSRKELVLRPRVSGGTGLGRQMTMECGQIVGTRQFNEESATPDLATRTDFASLHNLMHSCRVFILILAHIASVRRPEVS
jgi:hypothetical protein